MAKSRKKEVLAFMVSLGCPKNFVDTEVIAGSILTGGVGITPDPEEADIYIINTCAFIPTAREEAESVIKEAVKWKKNYPKTRKIIVCGCLVQWDKDFSIRNKFKAVDLWLGIDDIPEAGSLIIEALNENPKAAPLPSSSPEYLYDDLTPRLQLTLPHYAYIKISEGCSNRCSYCAIPSIRGTLRSRTQSSIVKEAGNLLESGVRELIIIGQDTTAYAADSGRKNSLAGLLGKLDKLDGDFWLRLLYTHPAHFTDKLIEEIASSKHVLPYIDMPLQHISDKLLKSMNRRTTSSEIRKLLKKIRSAIPDIAIRTTFITGYPGETDKDFEELLEFVKEQKFQRMGAFVYYPEPSTPAASMPGQVPAAVAAERLDAIMKAQSKISLSFNKSLAGKIFDVIVDAADSKNALGRTFMDAPEIDNRVLFTGKANPGDIVRVKITGASEYDLKGVVSKER